MPRSEASPDSVTFLFKEAIGILYAHGLREKLRHIGDMLAVVKAIFFNGGKLKEN